MADALSFAPRLLAAPEAARYLGISESNLRSLDLPRRQLGDKRLYDRLVLDEFASNLPTDEKEVEPCSEADAAFG